jgi:tRNA-splicing ligase RtcB
MQTIEVGDKHIKAWVDGVEFEQEAQNQVFNMASLPFIHSHIAVMPDVHAGIGATVGSVIPTIGAIVPAAVGVDIGCGMIAQRTSLKQEDLPDNLRPLRELIEATVPVGFAMHQHTPSSVVNVWANQLQAGHDELLEKYPQIDNAKALQQLGTMGGGNHFCEVTIDQAGHVWVVLHSGSRGIGNKIGQFFIARAKEEMQAQGIGLVDTDLAYLTENTTSFEDYVRFVAWAQRYAAASRQVMMDRVLSAFRREGSKLGLPTFTLLEAAVNCHHNYIALEHHYGRDVYVTRKGAVRAGKGERGIIPGSMGARSFITIGKGNPESFESCSHGAGRRMSRTKARKMFTSEDLAAQTQGVECRKDGDQKKGSILEEIPAAYKDVDAVMKAQADLVDIEHEFRQVICVKG